MQNLVRMAALATILVSVLTTPVRAQNTPTKTAVTETIPLHIKIGILRPSGEVTRTLSGSQVPGGLIDLSSSRDESAKTLTVGYFEGRSAGKSFRVAPLLITQMSSGGSGGASGVAGSAGLTGFFTSQGVGAYFVDAAGSGFKARFGGYAGAGLRLSGGLFVEAQYHYISGSVNGASPNGIALFIGRRN